MTIDLSTLTKDQASSLALIAGAAIRPFLNLQHNAQDILRQGGGELWLGQHGAELAQAKRWEAEARAFEKAAHARAFEAEREECRAVRAIEALAQALGDLCSRCRTYPVLTELDGDKLCKRCADAWVRAEGADQRVYGAEARAVAA